MKKMKTSKPYFFLAILLLVTSPLLAADTAENTTISVILRLWPYITGLVILLLAFLWYQQVSAWQKRRKDTTRLHTGRSNQLVFLSLITVFAALMLLAPSLLKRYEDKFNQQTETIMDPESRAEITLHVEGMTCTGCENAVKNSVASIPGVETVEASHTQHQAKVVYDKTKTNPEAIAQTIEDTGYKVVK